MDYSKWATLQDSSDDDEGGSGKGEKRRKADDAHAKRQRDLKRVHAAFSEIADRMEVDLASIAPLAEVDGELRPGTRVRLCGLSATELNGREGAVLHYAAARGRYQVVLDGQQRDEEPKGVKRANLEALPARPPKCWVCSDTLGVRPHGCSRCVDDNWHVCNVCEPRLHRRCPICLGAYQPSAGAEVLAVVIGTGNFSTREELHALLRADADLDRALRMSTPPLNGFDEMCLHKYGDGARSIDWPAFWDVGRRKYGLRYGGSCADGGPGDGSTLNDPIQPDHAALYGIGPEDGYTLYYDDTFFKPGDASSMNQAAALLMKDKAHVCRGEWVIIRGYDRGFAVPPEVAAKPISIREVCDLIWYRRDPSWTAENRRRLDVMEKWLPPPP